MQRRSEGRRTALPFIVRFKRTPSSRFFTAITFSLAFAAPAFAQAEKPPLKWGMDSTGGGPYVLKNATEGFEVELAAYLAKELGRHPEAEDADWDKLPNMLAKGDIDIVLNGYEYRNAFREQASIPYYIYNLTAVVNGANTDIQSWDDLRKGTEKRRVGVLEGSFAQTYMETTFGDSIRLEVYKDVANTYQLVSEGRLDATVQDNPAAVFYVSTSAGLRQLGKPARPAPTSYSHGRRMPNYGRKSTPRCARPSTTARLKKSTASTGYGTKTRNASAIGKAGIGVNANSRRNNKS